MDGFTINSWFDEETGEKNIELVWSDPLREVGFIANGMTPSELKGRLEMEIRAWKMVVNEKSEGRVPSDWNDYSSLLYVAS